jgi:hypothetical protein
VIHYEKYQPFRSWLKKVKDKKTIKAMAEAQGRKARQGNVFAVVGANGYVGWAMVCQLAYKFKGCKLILIDESTEAQESIIRNYDLAYKIDRLRYYFDFDFEIYTTLDCIKNTKPDFVINTKLKYDIIYDLINLNFVQHLINFTPFYNHHQSDIPFKVTEFRTPTILGTCNLVTLIDPLLSTVNTPNRLLNKMLVSSIEKKILVSGKRFICVSLEDITRAPIKIIRKGQDIGYRVINAYEKVITPELMAKLIVATMEFYNIDVKIEYGKLASDRLVFTDKKQFVRLIDKYRPPVDYLISYSCKNYLDYRC